MLGKVFFECFLSISVSLSKLIDSVAKCLKDQISPEKSFKMSAFVENEESN